ncbi:MAG: LamG domain-containing protein [Chloroflexota bacterium]
MKCMNLSKYLVFLSLSITSLIACNTQAAIVPPTATIQPTETTEPTTVPPTNTPMPQPLFDDVIDTTDLVAYYPFTESADDLSGYGNHGAIQDGTFGLDRFDQSGGAFTLDGTDDFIIIDDTKSLDLTFEMSIAVWFYHQTQASETWYTIVEKSDPERDGHSRYGMWLIRDLVEVCVQPVDLSWPQRCLDSEIPLESDQWHHLVGTSDGGTLRIYINGQPAGEQEFTPRSAISQSNFELFIGTDLYNASVIYTQGMIDELRLYKRTLTEEEVKILYEAER